MTNLNFTDITSRVREVVLETLSDEHYRLRKAIFEFQRTDGAWQKLVRESYNIGDGAAVLPIDREKGVVLLVRQFRWPAFEHGYRELVIEAIAGKLDGDDPEACALKEAREEAGVQLRNLRQVFHCFMSPGAVTERLHLFVADYESAVPRAEGGGNAHEGEDIEILELSLRSAMDMVVSGEIIDAKAILLLQWMTMNYPALTEHP
jgi:nudix-type nucleoside diphosphatase (YffH/AdpP family)